MQEAIGAAGGVSALCSGLHSHAAAAPAQEAGLKARAMMVAIIRYANLKSQGFL